MDMFWLGVILASSVVGCIGLVLIAVIISCLYLKYKKFCRSFDEDYRFELIKRIEANQELAKHFDKCSYEFRFGMNNAIKEILDFRRR